MIIDSIRQTCYYASYYSDTIVQHFIAMGGLKEQVDESYFTYNAFIILYTIY